jgi:putative transcription antitermination factor YqgF
LPIPTFLTVLRRTGVAFAKLPEGFVMALDTIKHTSTDELIESLSPIVKERRIDELVVGLPKLPGGKEGEQASIVRSTAMAISTSLLLPVTFIDERFSTKSEHGLDPDAGAACSILNVVVDQRK